MTAATVLSRQGGTIAGNPAVHHNSGGGGTRHHQNQRRDLLQQVSFQSTLHPTSRSCKLSVDADRRRPVPAATAVAVPEIRLRENFSPCPVSATASRAYNPLHYRSCDRLTRHRPI